MAWFIYVLWFSYYLTAVINSVTKTTENNEERN